MPVARPAPAPVVSVILPVYDEAEQIRTTFHKVSEFADRNPEYLFIFANDGSSDGTYEILRGLAAERAHPRVKVISYALNRGKGYALRRALPYACGTYVCFTDGDLAYSLDHLPRLVEGLKGNDIVIGSRALDDGADRVISPSRRLLGWTFNRLVRLTLRLPYRDTQAGLKGFRIDAARRIFRNQRVRGFGCDVELLYLARRFGYSVGEVPAQVSSGHAAKETRVDLLRDPIRMFAGLFLIAYYAVCGLYE
jgi:glycosyltransferase involved in cell wall biosynthesis